MRWFPSDYAADTRHLTLAEHGLYRQMLDLCWLHGGTIEDSPEWVAKRIGAPPKIVADCWPEVVQFFEKKRGEKLTHVRVLQEIAHAKGLFARASAGGKAKQAKGLSDLALLDDKSKQCYPEPEPELEPQPEADSRSKRPPRSSAGFDEFWATYPKKVGKKDARKAWAAAKDKPPVAAVVEAVEVLKYSAQWRDQSGRFVPNPATWLRRGGWDDEIAPQQDRERATVSEQNTGDAPW